MRGSEVGSLLLQPLLTEADIIRGGPDGVEDALECWFADMSCRRSSPYIPAGPFPH